jgi:hypothetical protein
VTVTIRAAAEPASVVSLDHRRDIRDLLALLATAHRNLDARGVPRTSRTTP